MKTRYFQKSINIGHNKEIWNFLKRHNTYDTLNSWNRLKSIANNVKVYNLPFKHDCNEVLNALQLDEYDYGVVNAFIEEWEELHPKYVVGFNGRSGGYLVLYNRENNGNILPNFITEYDSYEEFKKYNYKEIGSYYGSLLREYAKLVRDFDKLCDELIDVCDNLVEEYKETDENPNMLRYEVGYIDIKGKNKTKEISVEITGEPSEEQKALINEILKLGGVAIVTDIDSIEEDEDE